MVLDDFSIGNPQGNYTLVVRNGDGVSNGSSSALVTLNGETVVRTNEFNQNVRLIKKNVTVGRENQLGVQVRSMPGSSITVWVEDEAPDIVFTSPWDDTVSSGTITVTGYTADRSISMVTVNHNGVSFEASVMDGNFSIPVDLAQVNNITISGVDGTGTLRSASLLLDGDYLPASAEIALGFDPLDPDSDSSLTTEGESGNGVNDGFEVLNGDAGEMLPAFAKYRIGADPFKVDTDEDGLDDGFELLKLGLLTDVNSVDSNGDGVSDDLEDIDDDGLANVEEQVLGTDPLVIDSDRDGLSDCYEVNVSHTSPLSADPDGDGLQDDSELRLGMDPGVWDSDGNGVGDGDETYVSTVANETLGVTVSVTGKGDVAGNVSINEVLSEYYHVSPLKSSLVEIRANSTFDTATVTMRYDPSLSAANLSLCYFNETLGLFVPVPSTVDTMNHTVSASTTHFSMYGVADTNELQGMYDDVGKFNGEGASSGEFSLNGIHSPGHLMSGSTMPKTCHWTTGSSPTTMAWPWSGSRLTGLARPRALRG